MRPLICGALPSSNLGLLILGFGGHARSVADVALEAGWSRLLFVDANAQPDEAFAAFPVITPPEKPLADEWAVFSAYGSNAKRSLQEAPPFCPGAPRASVISPSASLGAACSVEEGVFVGRHAHIGPAAQIRAGAIINTGAIVEHEAQIGAYAHISVNATVAGRSVIGARSMVGAGGVVIDGVHVADDIIIGAGACVVKDLSVAGVYVGAPARLLMGDKA